MGNAPPGPRGPPLPEIETVAMCVTDRRRQAPSASTLRVTHNSCRFTPSAKIAPDLWKGVSPVREADSERSPSRASQKCKKGKGRGKGGKGKQKKKGAGTGKAGKANASGAMRKVK